MTTRGHTTPYRYTGERATTGQIAILRAYCKGQAVSTAAVKLRTCVTTIEKILDGQPVRPGVIGRIVQAAQQFKETP
jgi:hypothetical protein